MKRLLVKENTFGRKTHVNAQATYQADSGDWIAEVEGPEIHRACLELCRGISDCNLHVEADLDDDGKEYRVVSR